MAGSAYAQSTSRIGNARADIDVLHYEFRVDFPGPAFPDTIRFVATNTFRRTTGATGLVLDLTRALRGDSTQLNGGRPRSTASSPTAN